MKVRQTKKQDKGFANSEKSELYDSLAYTGSPIAGYVAWRRETPSRTEEQREDSASSILKA